MDCECSRRAKNRATAAEYVSHFFHRAFRFEEYSVAATVGQPLPRPAKARAWRGRMLPRQLDQRDSTDGGDFSGNRCVSSG